MKRSINSIVLLIISAVFIVSAFIAVHVEASECCQPILGHYTPQYTGTRWIQASLDLPSSIAFCGSTLEVYPGYNGYLTMYLQKKTSGSWSTVTSWSGSTAGSNGVSLDEFYANLIVGTTYRVRAVGMIYQNGTFVEQVSAISPEQTR